MEIIIKNLYKKYKKKDALSNINLCIDKGMYGLLGKNGAGKTTLLKILATLCKKSKGEITINGIDIENTKLIRKMIGYLPQNFSVYPNMSVIKVMEYFDVLSEMPLKNQAQRIEIILKKVNLWEEKHKKVKNLSGGMKQRLGIALAILNEPQILIVDEPTTALDPQERIVFRNMLLDLAKEKIIILSTHIAQDISATCDKVAVLHKGKLIFNDTVDKLKLKAQNKVFIIDEDTILPKNATIISKDDKKIKILSNTLPECEYKKVSPNIEEGYMQLIRECEKNEII